MPAIKGGWLEFERPEWERPSRPTDPGWGVEEGVGPGQGLPGGGDGGGAGQLPVFPLEPGQGLPGMPEGPGQGLPEAPPGSIWPPPDVGFHGRCIVGCYIVSSTGRRTHHYAVITIPERPDRPVDPGWGHPEGGRPGQGLPGGPEAPGQGLPGRPEYPSQRPPLQPPQFRPPSPGQPLPPQGRPPVAGQPLPRPPYQPPAGGVGGVPPQRPGPGYPDYPPGEFPGAGTPPTP